MKLFAKKYALNRTNKFLNIIFFLAANVIKNNFETFEFQPCQIWRGGQWFMPGQGLAGKSTPFIVKTKINTDRM